MAISPACRDSGISQTRSVKICLVVRPAGFVLLFSSLHCVVKNLPALETGLKGEAGRWMDTRGTALWQIGSPVWGRAIPWQHDWLLVRLSLSQSLHCNTHIFRTYLHCVSQHKMLHHEKIPPEVYKENFQQEYSFKGFGRYLSIHFWELSSYL